MAAVTLELGQVFGILTVLAAKLAERAVGLHRAIADFVRAGVEIGRVMLRVMSRHVGASAYPPCMRYARPSGTVAVCDSPGGPDIVRPTITTQMTSGRLKPGSLYVG